MKLLFLSHRLPCPPHKGEKIRALNIIRYLARRHEVHLASMVDDARDLGHVSLLRPHVRSLLVQQVHAPVRKAFALTALLGHGPITSRYFYSRSLQRRIDALIEREQLEAVFCSSSAMAEYVLRSRHADRLRSVPRIMDLIDVDSAKWQQFAAQSGPWIAWLYRREAQRLSSLEQRIGREFDCILVVTEAERRCFPGGVPKDHIRAMANGADLDYFAPARIRPDSRASPALVFTGVMDYRPNVEGVCWFADTILPRIREAVPDVQLYVVGNHPVRAVRRLARRPGITVTGFVPDIREYLAMAAVCIAPLRIARGIQNKVLEAMAMARPVVATPQAFDGIDAERGQDILVAATESDFAEQVVGLLREPQRAFEIGRCARACIERRYSWAGNLRLLDELLPDSRPADSARIASEPTPVRTAGCEPVALHRAS